MTVSQEKEKRPSQNKQDWYEILVEGTFNPVWLSWLEAWIITPLSDGNTLLTGPIIDQPALHGIFAQMRDMNVKIIALKKIEA
jgi:hypothetical protein